jgi:hypothetical protein
MAKQQQLMKKNEYLISLNRQMEEQKVKKKYDTLMTEHERRVNDRDIKAYEEVNTKDLYSKIPGIRSHD